MFISAINPPCLVLNWPSLFGTISSDVSKAIDFCKKGSIALLKKEPIAFVYNLIAFWSVFLPSAIVCIAALKGAAIASYGNK